MGADVRLGERSDTKCRPRIYLFFLFLLVPPHRTRHRLGILMVRNWSSALQRFNYVTLVSRSPLNSSLYVSGATERQVNLRFFLPTLRIFKARSFLSLNFTRHSMGSLIIVRIERELRAIF